jgi:hypothetical protein
MEVNIPEIKPKISYKETVLFRNEKLSEGSEIKKPLSQNVTITDTEYNEIVKKHGSPLTVSPTSPFMRDYLQKGFMIIEISHKGLGGTRLLYFTSNNINRIGKVYKLYI